MNPSKIAVPLAVWCLILMIPAHFLLLHFQIYWLGALPAAVFLGIAFAVLGIAFVSQYLQGREKKWPELGVGLSLLLVGFATAGFDLLASKIEVSNLPLAIGIVFFAGIIGLLASGLAAR